MSLADDIKNKKPIIGQERNVKGIRSQKVKRLYISSNFHAKNDLLVLCKNFGVDAVVLGENSKELGILCKKPFSISVLGFE